MKGIRIVGVGSYVPKKSVSNEDMSKIVDTSDEWIRSRTGIGRRYFANEESNAELAAKAGIKAMESSGIDKDKICCVIVATFTPDNYTPSVASEVHGLLGLPREAMAFDLNAACTGFIYSLQVAKGLLAENQDKFALIIGSEVISRVLDFTDRTTCVLFGDGAGAAVVKYCAESQMYSVNGCKSNFDVLYCKNNSEEKGIKMIGSEVFKFAVESIEESLHSLAKESGISLNDIDYIVCHQANERIISRVQKNLNLSKEKFFMDVEEYGNTSAASIPIAIDDMNKKNMLNRGDKVIMVGFGAGLLWSGLLIEW
ncbi:3-oxoacyl-[acyl-carrier-protein] synthase-3 [Hathewaya proteolytica DSM 3090]|uniref:Beta-ketoacyl-[acyl-carrier-protein] synthase III n=1 Tax=Hathewaya proteolytica DSM 3090 TaxID=1121331 RepID=A0A1M6M2C6_9CLOT|nr:beta-ketoacyl-ACP synthase III [Hathewaya proteolytica]SHJ77516.1 3-oxoacyl-[acyl-carrier-protein] synthase-3 [Hathewaya proteolytica DSM 3090]